MESAAALKLSIYDALCLQADADPESLPYPVDVCWAQYWEVREEWFDAGPKTQTSLRTISGPSNGELLHILF